MYEGNVGSVARAMKNFGFHDLVLVNPCRIGDFGRAMASHARDLLAEARIVSTLDDVLSGADLVVGTTGKRTDADQRHLRLFLRQPCLTPEELCERLSPWKGDVALLFGPEDSGLSNEELMDCDLVVSIPTSVDYPVMNLSHSVAILLYELSAIGPGKVKMAEKSSLDRLYERYRDWLFSIDYPPHKIDYTMLMLKRIYGRSGLTEREVNTILGALKKAEWSNRRLATLVPMGDVSRKR